jgi:Predicted integral membrane protein (DUF2282)
MIDRIKRRFGLRPQKLVGDRVYGAVRLRGEHACTTVERSSSIFSLPCDVVTVTTCFPNSSSEQRQERETDVCKITSISFAFPASVTATNLPTAIEQRCRCSLDHRSRVARFSRLTRWSPEMKTLLLIADAGSVPTPQFAAEKHWCSYVSRQARDANSWIYVPVGTCTKIAGGSLKKA